MPDSDGGKRGSQTKLIELTRNEWSFLQEGLANQREVKQLLSIRNGIQDECEKLMLNLSDASLFLPQLDQIRQYLKMLEDAKSWITVHNLDDSRISECLCYLIDLCLVISKYELNLTQVKQVG